MSAEPRPKRRCVLEAEASRQALVTESDESDGSDESDESYGSDGSDLSDEGRRESEIDDITDHEGESEDREHDEAGKVKRESRKRLAALLGLGVLEMQRGAFVLVKLSSSNISQFLDTVYARGNVDAAVREAASTMLAPFTEVAESARAWASPAVDSLAAVFGGDAIRVFRDLASWTAGMYVYIALRLSRIISSAGSRAVEDMQIALALGAGPTAPPSLRFLAATQFLELAVASIRADAGHAPMQIAGSILRELASEYAFLRGSLRSLERTKQGPRARPVDMTLPKGFPGKCGPGNHAITYQPKLLLEIERCEDEKRLASIVSNKELYGSGSVSMFTAAQEIRRLLHLGPLTKRVWRAIPEDAAVLLSASVHYFPHSSGGDDVKSSPGSRVEFGKTKHQQRCSCCARKIHYIRFEKRHLLCALERPDIVRVLFSPHYNRSGKGLTLALVKIKLSVYPSSRLLRSGSTKSLDYLRKMIECHNNNQKQNRSRHRFFEGQVLFR